MSGMMSNSPRRIFNTWDDNGLPAGERHIGQIGKALTTVSASFIVDPDADYAALDVCATPNVPTLLSGCARVSGGKGVIRDAVVVDRGDVFPALTFVFLSASPANAYGNDNAAFALNDADADKVVGTLTVATADYKDFNVNRVAYKKDANIYFDCATGQSSLWCLVQADGPWNAGGKSDLGITLKIEQF